MTEKQPKAGETPLPAKKPWAEVLGFSCLGLSIGAMVGLSGNAAVEAVASAVFALVGGSSIVFITKLDPASRRVAGTLVSALSVFMLVGLIGGLWANQREVLGPKVRLASLEGVLAEVATQEIDRLRAAGTPVSLAEVAKLMEVAGKSSIGPYLNANSGSRIQAIIHRESIGILSKEKAFDAIKEISLDN